MGSILRQLVDIRKLNQKNTGIQTHVKTIGDAFINPINYELREIKDFIKTDKEGEIIINREKYIIPKKQS